MNHLSFREVCLIAPVSRLWNKSSHNLSLRCERLVLHIQNADIDEINIEKLPASRFNELTAQVQLVDFSYYNGRNYQLDISHLRNVKIFIFDGDDDDDDGMLPMQSPFLQTMLNMAVELWP